MTALWDTNGSEIIKALAVERRTVGGVVSGLALTLVVVVPEERVAEVEAAAATASAAHPCRVLVVVRDPGDTGDGSTQPRLDAEIMVGGRLGPTEAVVLRAYGALIDHIDSVVRPLLAPDVPVVTWWHEAPPPDSSSDQLGDFAQRRVTDIAQAADPAGALRQLCQGYTAGDTDLAWTRLSPWRSLLVNALDAGAVVEAAAVVADPDDPSTALLCGWLCSRLGIEPEVRASAGGTGHFLDAVTLRLGGGRTVAVERADDGAVLRSTGHPDRPVALRRRTLGDHLAEELRQLAEDRTYAAALTAAVHHLGRAVERHAPREHGVSENAVIISEDAGQLARDVADRLLTRLAQVQSRYGDASIVLTGGRIARQIYAQVRHSPDLHTVDWRQVDVWWSDERFLPAGHPDRNETQVRAALLDALPVDPARIHPMPASDTPGVADVDAAAGRYVEQLRGRSVDGSGLPRFDLAVLSVGEDGHVASVFPHHPAGLATTVASGVHHSPKPPADRVTLSLAAISTAAEVWLLGAGRGKAAAVARALAGGADDPVPAAQVHGREKTVWLLDTAAAAGLA